MPPPDDVSFALIHTDELPWSPSPAQGVERKRLEHSGPEEAGRVTSLVRYAPGSRFHAHPHPGGEEILVLDGVFTDDRGDHPAGTFMLNPEGYTHAPSSTHGCVLFVKLRQSPGARRQVRIDTTAVPFSPHPTLEGVSTVELYAQTGFPEQMRLVRFAPGVSLPHVPFPGGEEILVLEGTFADEHGEYRPLSWVRYPPGGGHTPRTETGCLVYIKKGHLAR